jgi:hypothetical protein
MELDDPLNTGLLGDLRIDWLQLAKQLGGLYDAANQEARRLQAFVDRRRRWWSRHRNWTQDAAERVRAYAGDETPHGRWRRQLVFLNDRNRGNAVGSRQPAGVKLTGNKLDDPGNLGWGRRRRGRWRRRGHQ